jgi:hypothetical protein
MSRTINYLDKQYVSMTKTELRTIAQAMATIASADDLDGRIKGNLKLIQKALLVGGYNPSLKVLSNFLVNCDARGIDTRHHKRGSSNTGARSLAAFQIGDENGSQWVPKSANNRDAINAARREVCLNEYQKVLQDLGFNEATVPNPIPGPLNEMFEEVAGPYLSALADLLDEAKQDRVEHKALIMQMTKMRAEIGKLADDAREKWYGKLDRRIEGLEESINLIFQRLPELDRHKAA